MSSNDLFSKLVPEAKTDHGGVTLGDIIVIVLNLALLIYTGYRSWHFLDGSLPEAYKVLALAGLWGLDVGALAWSLVWIFGSTTRYQDWASITMFVVDLIGMFLTSMVDSLMFTVTGTVVIPPILSTAALYGIPAIILLNVVVGFIYHMTSPNTRKARAERRMREELALEREKAEMELKRKQLHVEQSQQILKQREMLVVQEQQLAEQKIKLDGIEQGLNATLGDKNHADTIAGKVQDDIGKRLGQFKAAAHADVKTNGNGQHVLGMEVAEAAPTKNGGGGESPNA